MAALSAVAAVVVAVPGLAQTPPGAGEIHVTVNGDALVFPGQGPIMSGTSILVPLRGVFEKLGAGVRYEAPTRTITATRNETTIALRLGDPNALVNNKAQQLTVPAQMVNGSTLVPLRFVSESLGARVKWDAVTRTVQITTAALAAENLPPPPAVNTPVTGSITGLFPEDNAVTIRVPGGDNTRVTLTSDARVLAKRGDQPATTAPLASLRVGDQVTVRRDNEGKAYDLEVDYDERKGELKSVEPGEEGASKITLSDGTVVTLVANAPLTMAGNAIALTDLKPGEKIVVRVNPATSQGISADITPPDPIKVEVAMVEQSAGTKVVRSGEEVTVTVVGTPAAKGTFTVAGLPGVAEQPLTESPTKPGTYTGTFKVPDRVALIGAAVSAALTIETVTSPASQAATPLNIDAAGPVLAELSPAENSRMTEQKPDISGTYTDMGTGVEPAQTQILVNGKDVTAQAKVTKSFFLYRPAADLPPGNNTITIVAKDVAGNETRKEWSFVVMPIVNPVKVVTFDPEGRTLGAGDVLTVRAEATPGGTARFSIGSAVAAIAMPEESPGIYKGAYVVKKGDSIGDGKVNVTFLPGDGGKEWALASVRTVSISAGAPAPPVIDLPAEGANVGGYVTISGHGTPNTTVRLSLRYDGKRVLISTGGGLASLNLKVGTDGRWTTELLTLETPRGASGLTFTAEAVTITTSGETSEPATVRFKK